MKYVLVSWQGMTIHDARCDHINLCIVNVVLVDITRTSVWEEFPVEFRSKDVKRVSYFDIDTIDMQLRKKMHNKYEVNLVVWVLGEYVTVLCCMLMWWFVMMYWYMVVVLFYVLCARYVNMTLCPNNFDQKSR